MAHACETLFITVRYGYATSGFVNSPSPYAPEACATNAHIVVSGLVTT